MRATRIMANLPVADIETAKSFYTDFLGPNAEEFNLGWAAPTRRPAPERIFNSSPTTRRPLKTQSQVQPFMA